MTTLLLAAQAAGGGTGMLIFMVAMLAIMWLFMIRPQQNHLKWPNSREYLALPDGPGWFTQNSSCSALLRIPLGFDWLRIRNYHALWLNFPEHSTHQFSCHNVVLQPHICRNIGGLGWSPFARHY